MPALRPCLRCGVLTRRAGGYCIECQPPYPRGKQRSGGKQQTFRRKTLQTFGLRCLVCGSTENVEAAHDLALDMTAGQQASFDQAENGIPLCRRCHRAADAAVRRARKRLGCRWRRGPSFAAIPIHRPPSAPVRP
jgi:hypothetical protein